MKVEDLMTRNVHAVTRERPLKDVAALLAEHRIGGMPVLDGNRTPVGVITNADIVLKERGPTEPPKRGLFHRKAADDGSTAKAWARTAGDAMSSPAITIAPVMPVASAAEWMIGSGVNRLPVVDARGRLVGIITRHDLVRVFARSDAEIEREIRDETLSTLSWPEAIEIRVENGEVTLRGQADTVIDAETIPQLVRHVLGVVEVDSELTVWDPARERSLEVRARA
jgi:CBS domain-containing protein